MPWRVGVLAARLQDSCPRGVHRVARAVAEHLAAVSVLGEFEFVCLTDRLVHPHEITYNSYDLAQWLAHHPLRRHTPGAGPVLPQSQPPAKSGLARKLKTLGVSLCPTRLLPFLYHRLHQGRKLRHLYRHVLRPLASRIVRPARTLARLLLRRRAPLPPSSVSKAAPVCLKPTPFTLRQLDLVISFEMFEELWELPVENYPARLISWFYDAIPKRIDEGFFWNPELFDRALSRCALKADRIICISESARRDLHDFAPRSRGKACVIPLGHDAERFRQSPAGSASILAKFGIDPTVPYFVMVGRVEPRKNVTNVLLACMHLCQNMPGHPIQLVIAGEDPGCQAGLPALLARARRLLPVILTGYANDEDVAGLLAGSTAFLFPALWEGFGIPPLEAMTAGTLVITSDLSSLPEVCGDNAVYCDPYDPADMAQAMLRCLHLPTAEREARIRQGRQHAARFTWQRTGDQVFDLVRDVLSGSKRDASGLQPFLPEDSRSCA